MVLSTIAPECPPKRTSSTESQSHAPQQNWAWLNLFDHLVGDKRRQDRKQSTERYRHNVIGAGRPAAHYAFLDRSLGELRDA
jgi:hypothetical protein